MKSIIGIILVVVLAAGCLNTQPSPEAEKLFLPKDSEKPVDSIAYTDSALTLILAPGDNILYYTGAFKDQPQVNKVDYKGIREVLVNFKKKTDGKMVVLIKPHASATYKNTVDILDEMTINEIKKYALVDLSDEEKRTLLDSK
ncbi:hypothetical protein HB364_30805 [Pseudoflavitalea sp. X16]|uniref:biopolymer transporter ExbD n=1 Tax=Paraflavitalea devenefica TaxID=2716334 RepID=UPI00141EC8DD|nr:biopolymer transporter ExbD [Paraflavitalea devenefica]NII29510.1 hypothetical protein [Paraflavitalea devenefica]